MSCGFAGPCKAIQKAINDAFGDGILILAAAGNAGAIEEWRWPASDHNVLGITAAHGNGNKYGNNPTPSRNSQSFSMLGYAVEGYLRAVDSPNPTKVRQSGTSHATAMATAVAAITMQILRDCKDEIIEEMGREAYDYTERTLRTKSGMETVFRQMSGQDQPRDGYCFVKPWTIVHEFADPRMKALHIARNLVQWCGANLSR
jgi:hypothetical protein